LKKTKIKIKIESQEQWLKCVILATREEEIRRIAVPG
jgi:hypothetical protein